MAFGDFWSDPVEAAKDRTPPTSRSSYFPAANLNKFADNVTAGSIYRPGAVDDIFFGGAMPTATPGPKPSPTPGAKSLPATGAFGSTFSNDYTNLGTMAALGKADAFNYRTATPRPLAVRPPASAPVVPQPRKDWRAAYGWG